ncbi:MAG: helix-turn-helix domain-containing protein [Prolixibacteraceae bacterium]|nr:MAG: Transposon Tn10 TetD protein [Bacteroidetes bacterium ADurb.Bin123]HNZ68689.1 helix-turn-helix domain-containing protein [Prolixibacteraceae bacterium]HOC87692.1 helix-turn-helix domain-containing protein [Prolixibacteraceae bacterium]HOG95675.1 helix-turn-helix domain-containing protein [Prolixibacteraceae bacterium]HOY92188.1 helix-turn-helix domain-containing protein [Prolixibacteraceae bacterium]
MIRLENISQFNELRGIETLHPLVSVFEFSKMKLIPESRAIYGFYCVFLKEAVCGDLKYGCNYYDYQEGTLVFIAPGQVVGIGNKPGSPRPKGWGLLFHPDIIRGTTLGKNIKQYSFFSYEANEALHLSEKERSTIVYCLTKIDHELQQSIDRHSKTLIANNIELLLNYCLRYYDRQFITRSMVNKDILVRFERLLDDYFQSEAPHLLGLPTVKYFANELHLSANYFGDLIKKETGMPAQDHIRLKLINLARQLIFDRTKTVSEIAYQLGFKHSQHFSRMFKAATGYTPIEFRTMN